MVNEPTAEVAAGKGRRPAPHAWRAVLYWGSGVSTSGRTREALGQTLCCAHFGCGCAVLSGRLPRARPPHTCIPFREVLHFGHQSLQTSACFPEWGLVPVLVTCALPADVTLTVCGLSEEGLEGLPSPQTICCFPKTRVFVCLRRKPLLVRVAWVFLLPVRWNTSDGRAWNPGSPHAGFDWRLPFTSKDAHVALPVCASRGRYLP